MRDDINRRDVLRSAGELSVVVTAYSSAAAAYETHSGNQSNQREKSKLDEKDFSLFNNSTQEEKVQVKIKDEGGEVLYSKQFALQGANNPTKKEGQKTFLSGNVNSIPHGEYTIEFRLSEDEQASVPMFFNLEGGTNSQAINAYIHPDGSLSASLSIG
ncbi:MAG: hypothetical protein ABEH81_07950 [Halopenitus sp.]